MVGRRGFTFVELLIAVTMMAILFVGLGAHLRGGITVWRRVTTTAEALQRQRVALDQLEHELSNAIISTYQSPTLPVEFRADRLQWLTVAPTSAVRAGQTAFVTYQCAEVGGVRGLWRTSQHVGEALVGAAATDELLVPSCESMELHYAYLPSGGSGPLVWAGPWTTTDDLPRFVSVSVRFGPGREAQRIVWIPVGVLKPL